MKIPNSIGKLAQRVIDGVTGTGGPPEGAPYCAPGVGTLIRQGAAESCVLLKNDGTLPLSKQDPVAVFGRCQLDWFYVGYGSGGDVLMPGDFGHIVKKYKPDPSLLETLGMPVGITRAELERTALRVLQLVLKLRYRD